MDAASNRELVFDPGSGGDGRMYARKYPSLRNSETVPKGELIACRRID
jgi:hypothetical protein